MNIRCMDVRESSEQRKGERDDQQVYRVVGEGISHQAHKCGRDKTPCGGEALIAPKPLGQGPMTDQAKTDRSDRRSQYPASDSL